MNKFYTVGYSYSNEDNDPTWSFTSNGIAYSTYELALAAAQQKTDKDRKDYQILVAIATVKYPVPSFPVEKIS